MCNKCLPPNKKTRQAVITVPANFSEQQREETINAAKLAKIDVLGLLNEPTAVCMACAYVNDFLYENPSSNIIIFDFGAGTLDVSLIHVENTEMNDKLKFNIIGIDGDIHLGGRDFDNIIFNYVVDTLGLNRNNERLMANTMQSVVDAKIYLSMQEEAEIIIYDSILDYNMILTRRKFEELTSSLINRIIYPVERVLDVAQMSINNIDYIILTGGSCHMPFVKEKLTNFFGKEPFEGIDPQEAVAKGAAIAAYNKVNNIEGQIENLVLYKDVASRSIGIATDDGNMSFHIFKNQPLPVNSSIIYENQNNEEGLSIYIFEGENKKCELNDYLGKFEIHGIPKSPQGEHKIQVTFIMNENGIIHAEAHLLDSEIQASINVVRYIGYYPEKLLIEKRGVINDLIRKQSEDPIKKLYRMALAYFNDSDNKMRVYLGKEQYDVCSKELNYGVQNLSSSTSSVAASKNKIRSLFGQYFVIHRSVPLFLQNLSI